MSLRIWHQSFTVLGDVPVYREALAQRVSEIVRPGTIVDLHGQIPGTFPADYPGTDLAYNFLYWLHGIQWVAAAREAERQGYDAMVLASMSDPMLREIRTIVDIPVVGYGESVFNYAGYYGRRIGMLVFIAERKESWPERIRQWGMQERFAGVMPAGVTFKEVVAAYSDPVRCKAVLATVAESAERLIRETGADLILPAEMPLNLLLAREKVSSLGSATVLDGLATCLSAAESVADLQKSSGMSPSARGFFNVRPDKARVQQALEFYGLADLGRRIPKD